MSSSTMNILLFKIILLTLVVVAAQSGHVDDVGNKFPTLFDDLEANNMTDFMQKNNEQSRFTNACTKPFGIRLLEIVNTVGSSLEQAVTNPASIISSGLSLADTFLDNTPTICDAMNKLDEVLSRIDKVYSDLSSMIDSVRCQITELKFDLRVKTHLVTLKDKFDSFRRQNTVNQRESFVNACSNDVNGILTIMSNLKDLLTDKSNMELVLDTCINYESAKFQAYFSEILSIAGKAQVLYMGCAMAADYVPQMDFEKFNADLSKVVRYYRSLLMHKLTKQLSSKLIFEKHIKSLDCDDTPIIKTSVMDRLNQLYGYWQWDVMIYSKKINDPDTVAYDSPSNYPEAGSWFWEGDKCNALVAYFLRYDVRHNIPTLAFKNAQEIFLPRIPLNWLVANSKSISNNRGYFTPPEGQNKCIFDPMRPQPCNNWRIFKANEMIDQIKSFLGDKHYAYLHIIKLDTSKFNKGDMDVTRNTNDNVIRYFYREYFQLLNVHDRNTYIVSLGMSVPPRGTVSYLNVDLNEKYVDEFRSFSMSFTDYRLSDVKVAFNTRLTSHYELDLARNHYECYMTCLNELASHGCMAVTISNVRSDNHLKCYKYREGFGADNALADGWMSYSTASGNNPVVKYGDKTRVANFALGTMLTGEYKSMRVSPRACYAACVADNDCQAVSFEETLWQASQDLTSDYNVECRLFRAGFGSVMKQFWMSYIIKT